MRKKMLASWKRGTRLGILCSLCVVVFAVNAAEQTDADDLRALQLKLQEAQIARRVAERRCAEYEADSQRAESELAGLRRRYCWLYLESSQLQQDLEYLELRIAGLLTDREDIASGRALSRALIALDELQSTPQELGEAVRAFGVYLDSVLDVLQPSATLRREVAERFAVLTNTVERPVQSLASVAGRASEKLEPRTCRVLA